MNAGTSAWGRWPEPASEHLSPTRHPVPWHGLVAISTAFAAVLLAASGGYGYHRDELYFIAIGGHPAFGYVAHPRPGDDVDVLLAVQAQGRRREERTAGHHGFMPLPRRGAAISNALIDRLREGEYE